MGAGRRVEGLIGSHGNVAKVCFWLSVLAFVLAVVTVFTGPLVGVHGESYSHASTNLALLALCLFIGFKEKPTAV